MKQARWSKLGTGRWFVLWLAWACLSAYASEVDSKSIAVDVEPQLMQEPGPAGSGCCVNTGDDKYCGKLDRHGSCCAKRTCLPTDIVDGTCGAGDKTYTQCSHCGPPNTCVPDRSRGAPVGPTPPPSPAPHLPPGEFRP